MLGLVGIGAGVLLACLVGVELEHAGGDRAIVGRLLVGMGGLVTGILVAFILGLALWPGACLAVLCPMCYRAPTADALWQAGVLYFGILGALGGLLPGSAFRAGYGGGVLAVLLPLGALADWTAGGNGGLVLVGAAVCILAWVLRAAVWRVLGGSPEDGPRPAANDFWDGSGWRSGAAARDH